MKQVYNLSFLRDSIIINQNNDLQEPFIFKRQTTLLSIGKIACNTQPDLIPHQ